MSALVGLGLAALAFLVPSFAPSARRPARLFATALLDIGVRFGVLTGGLALAAGASPRHAVSTAVGTGGTFAVLMGVLTSFVLGGVYLFRRADWEFGRAWIHAGYTGHRRRAGLLGVIGELSRSQRRGEEVKRLRTDWLAHRHEGVTAEAFLAMRKSEIDSRLGPPDG
jgi:hypothetical protein